MPSQEPQRPIYGSCTFLPATSSTGEFDHCIQSVTPARRDWLKDLLFELLPTMYEATMVVAERHNCRLATHPRTGMVSHLLQEVYGVTAGTGAYASAIASCVARLHDTEPTDLPAPDCSDAPPEYQTLLQVGMGLDAQHTGLDALSTGPLKLVKIHTHMPQVILELDEAAWRNAQRAQRKRGLQTIATLMEALDIKLVASPQLQQYLTKLHPDWIETHLTEPTKTPHVPAPQCSSHPEPSPEQVYTKLAEFTTGGGRLALLKALPGGENGSCTVRELKNNPDLTLSPGTIDRYYLELAREYEFLEVTKANSSNVLSLTPAGRLAQNLITDDLKVKHPFQTNLTETTSTPSQPHTRIVPPGDPPHPNQTGDPPEKCLGADALGVRAPTAHPLSLPDCWLDEHELVTRFNAGVHAEGITLVNDPITEFSDGRTTYIGGTDEEVHIIVQWGGPLPTLARLGATLLSERAFDRFLTRTRVEPLLAQPMGMECLRLGRQLGWLSDTERDYDRMRKRYQQLGTSLLRRLPSRDQSPDQWTTLCGEAHGLLATATQLYDALDFDLTLHVRVPDTAQLSRNDRRYQQFLDFLHTTVPKQAAYRGNSAHRLLIERDGDKLGYRFPVAIDSTDSMASLTANWVITGPSVTTFRDDILKTLSSVPVRDQVARGTEDGITIPIEVACANHYSILKQTIRNLLTRLDRSLAPDSSLDSITQLYLSVLDDPTNSPGSASPFCIAEAVLAADRLAPPNTPLSRHHLVRGLGAVSADRLYPWLAPAARKIMYALLAAPEPLSRSGILEATSISKTSYYRHRSVLEQAGLLHEAETHRYDPILPGEPNRENAGDREPGSSRGRELYWTRMLLRGRTQAAALTSKMGQTPVSGIHVG